MDLTRSKRVTKVLLRLLSVHVTPLSVRSDTGPEFVHEATCTVGVSAVNALALAA